ncbi:MAG TPA: PHP domain-containing protein [Bryobacteraceae bacterium]|nr:PHP domain-containing protein [Bryobacteraceae bacterium]
MIDLHTHTDRSDGTASPAQLVRDAVALGLEALGITDHDTLEGYDIAVPLAAEAGLELICGIELSTRPERPPDGSRPPSVHLLGYFLQGPASPDFRQWIRGHQESRRERNRKLIAKLNSLGVDITLEEVQVLGKHLTGRPHFAKILLKKGYVKTNQEAFDRYLADNASASVERDEPELVEGVRKIREGGGMPSLAHPVRLPQRDRASLEKLLRELIDNGLQGLEVYHSEHQPEDTALYKDLAARFNLIETGGTDYHGDNKPAIHLGTGKNNNMHTTYELLEGMRRGVRVMTAR